MKVNVFYDRENLKKTLEIKGTVKDLLEKLKINETTVIVARDDKVLLSSEKLKENDSLKILSVVSGG